MDVISISEFRRHASKIFDRVGNDGERIVLRFRGKPMAALVHPEDAAYLEELEDRHDLEEYRKTKKEFEESGEKGITLEEVAKELGIELPR